MLDLRAIEAKHLSQFSVQLDWSFHLSPEPLKSYYMQVWGGEAINSMAALSPPLMGALSFFHALLEPRQHYVPYYYRLKWWPRADPPRFRESPDITTIPPADPVAAELASKHEMVLRLKSGLPVAVYRHRTEGKRCPVCWDVVRQRALDKECKTCLGTGILEGFYRPIYKYINIKESASADRIRRPGDLMEDIQGVATIGAHPALAIRDVLVEEHNGRAWRLVRKVDTQTDKLRFPIKQVWGLAIENPNLVEASLRFDPED